MTGAITVELSDLRGWAVQVGRAAEDLGTAHTYGARHLTDADFGRILELITGEYAGLLPTFHAVLKADGDGLGKARDALDASATTYKAADDRSRDRIVELPGGEKLDARDDGVANGFDDTSEPTASLSEPTTAGAVLPEISLGFLLDKVCDLIVWAGLRDPREYITRWIAGDIEKASRHVATWQHVADCVDGVDGNLDSGRETIKRTWTGEAATASAAHMDAWSTCLETQSGAMRKIATHLNDAIDQAVKMAQVVVDIIRTVVSLISAAWTNAAIPGYGQWKLIKTIKDAWPLINGARKVITVFWNAITMIKDLIIACVDAFTVGSLPPAASAEVPA